MRAALFSTTVLLLCSAPLSSAQTPPGRTTAGPAPVPDEISVVALAGAEPPRLFLRETAKGPRTKEPRVVPLDPGFENIPPAVKIPVECGRTIWALKGDEEPEDAGDASWRPFEELPGRPQGERWLLILFTGADGALSRRLIKASESAHPPRSVRILNLSNVRMAASVERDTSTVSPGGEAVLRPEPNDQGRFPFQAVLEGGGSPAAFNPRQMLRFRGSNDRLLVVAAHQPLPAEFQQGGEHFKAGLVPQVTRLYDRVGTGVPAGGPATAAATPVVEMAGAPGAQDLQALAFVAGRWWADGSQVEIAADEGGEAFALDPSGAMPKPLTLRLSPGRPHQVALRKGGIPMATAVISSASGSALLAAAGPTDATTSPSLLVFENSPQSHPPGTRRLFNLTPYQLAYSRGAGGEAVYVNPREAVLVQAPSVQTPTRLAIQLPEGWKLLGSLDAGPLSPQSRRAVFVYPEDQNSQFAFKEAEL